MKNSKKRIISLIIVIVMIFTMVAGVILSAFSAFAAPVRDSSGLEIGQTSILYDNSNGLPTSEANAIVQTEDGFLWIGSYSGLVRFDGSEFARIDSTSGIASVVSLYVDTKGRLWVGTNDSGAAVMEKDGSFTFFGKDKGLHSLSIRDITEDGEGDIVLATTEGMYEISPDNEIFPVGEDKIGKEYIYSTSRDTDGIVYGITAEGKAFYLKDNVVSDFITGESAGTSSFVSIYADPRKKGYVYLGTESGEIVSGNIQQGMKDAKSFDVDGIVNINAIRFVDDLMWFCADNGIGYIDENNNVKILDNVPMAFSVDDIMQDYEGNLWFTSSRQGVMEITVTNFKDISRSADLPQTVVNTTCIYDDMLYLGCDTGLIIVKNGSKMIENDLTKRLDGVRIRSIKESSDGNLWLSTYSEYGLICVHKDGSTENYNTSNGLISDRVRTVCELSDGTIAGSGSEGIFFIKNGKVVKTLSRSDGLDNLEILTICEGDDGEIYLGSDGNGIYILKDDKITHLGTEDGLKSEVILRFKKDPMRKGIYWIITSNSIAFMKDGRITTVDDFPYANNFDIFSGNGDDIWVLCSAGIYRVNAQQMLNNEKPVYSFYGKDNGLPLVTTANSRNYLAENGDLYISGTTGVASFNIYDNFESGEQVKLAVPYISIGDRIYTVDQTDEGKYKVTIPKSARRISINAFALTYRLTNPVISYKLEGFDEEATYISKRDMTPITYTNLQGGEYKFRLSTVDANSREVTGSIVVRIIKPRWFYEMPVFWIVVLAVIVIITSLLIRRFIRRQLERSERKQKEIQVFLNTVTRAFAKVIDFKDRYTNGHSFRVAKYTKLLAKSMGYDEERVDKMYNIALLHDIGKITIPDEILNKPSGLTDEEFEIMKSHAANGESILEEIKADPELSIGAGYHHERLDGKGYPRGVAGADIPMVAQIIAVADTFDAMYSTRAYSKKKELSDVIAELRRVEGTQLNKDVVEHLVTLAEEGALGAENVK